MDKQPVGQLPDLASSNNDDEIMVITNSEYNQLKKEKIADFITDLASTDENNAIVKGADGKLFTKDFGNASNITEGTLPVSVLPNIPKDKLPEIETDDLPDSGITAGTYTYPTDIVVNSKGQVTSITEGQAGTNNANQDLSNISEAGKEVIRQNSVGMPVGTIFAHTCAADFVPENSLPCDGTEYTQTQFPTFYNDWLVGARLNTCTYEEYQSDIDTYGKCVKFGLDTASGKFKVPTIPDGTHIQQAMSDEELGKSYNAGLPDITYSNEQGILGSPFTGALSGNSIDSSYRANANTTTGAAYIQQVQFKASDANSIYSDEITTVQTESVAVRFFVVVATGAINQSEMDWSEWATGLQTKLNADHSNDTKPYIIESYENDLNGYITYSNGLHIEYGVNNIPADGNGNVTLIKQYKNTNYLIFTSLRDISFNIGKDCGTGAMPLTEGSFTIRQSVQNAINVQWHTLGYINLGE